MACADGRRDLVELRLIRDAVVRRRAVREQPVDDPVDAVLAGRILDAGIALDLSAHHGSVRDRRRHDDQFETVG